MIRISLALVLLLVFPSIAHGWGREAHRLIGEIAEAQLTAVARTEVTRLLLGEADPTLAGVSAWADVIRDDKAWRWTAPMHYVKFDDARCVYRAEGNCRDDLCVVGAIDRYSRVLGDRSQPDQARREALKFLVHFIGDVHQPLHAGYRPDRGGNDFQVSIDGEGSNLHSVWDSRFSIASLDPRRRSFDTALKKRPAAQLSKSTAQWANESCLLTDSDGFYPRRPGRLPKGYLQQFESLAAKQTALAGARLAATLNTALAPADRSE